MIEKPLVTVSGKKILFNSNLHQRISQDIPQEGIEWRRRLDSNAKSVYIDVDFVDFDVDCVERSSERLSKLSLQQDKSSHFPNSIQTDDSETIVHDYDTDELTPDLNVTSGNINTEYEETTSLKQELTENLSDSSKNDISCAFFNKKLLGRPILHTYWADKTDFEDENQKSQFEEWIGKVQASSCTEWAIIIIEDGDFKAQLGTALFKSKLQSSTSQSNSSSTSISSITHSSSHSFLERMKKGLATMFQSDTNSDRWLTLVRQDRQQDNRAQDSYNAFIKKFRSLVMASFSKQIELFEEQLRVQREMRIEKNWDFFSFFSMQEELAFAFEFLTLFDEALLQYDLLDALSTEYISSPNFNSRSEPLYEQWTSFKQWQGLCLDLNNSYSNELRKRIVERRASLLDLRNYLFAKQCDLMLMQNQPWRVAESTTVFLQSCTREHELLNIELLPGALSSWTFVSALEVLQKCECYSCTSTMENYSRHTVDIWNCARIKLLELGNLLHLMPGMDFRDEHDKYIGKLFQGIGPDPHPVQNNENNEISPLARLKDALASKEQFSKHLIEISELTLGTYKHIGRKRHALLVGKEMAQFYIAQNNSTRAMTFLLEFEKSLLSENWDILLNDVRKIIAKCNKQQVTDKSNGNE